MKLERVFHPSDFTHGDEAAFAHALRIAVAARSRFQMLHVKKPDDHVEWSQFPRVRSTLAQWELLPPDPGPGDLEKLGLRVSKAQRTDEEPVAAIVNYMRESQPDLVVMATHQHQGVDRWLLGSIAESVARATSAATLFIPRTSGGFVDAATGEVRLRTILIPVDRRPNPQTAADAAATLARTLCCPKVHFIFLHVGASEDAPTVRLPEEPGWTAEFQYFAGRPADLILTSARVDDPKPDLLVMATQGSRGFLGALLGGTTERVLAHVPCPLLAVPTIS